MDNEIIRAFRFLLIGYAVLRTDATVTVTAYNTLPDGISFEKGSQGVVICTINPYYSYFFWEIDGSKAAECIAMSCPVFSTVKKYNFTFDTTNGIFNISINPVEIIDRGKEFRCHDGSTSQALNVTVKETEDSPPTSDGSNSDALLIGLSVTGSAVGSVCVGVVVVTYVKTRNKRKARRNTQSSRDAESSNQDNDNRDSKAGGSKSNNIEEADGTQNNDFKSSCTQVGDPQKDIAAMNIEDFEKEPKDVQIGDFIFTKPTGTHDDILIGKVIVQLNNDSIVVQSFKEEGDREETWLMKNVLAKYCHKCRSNDVISLSFMLRFLNAFKSEIFERLYNTEERMNS